MAIRFEDKYVCTLSRLALSRAGARAMLSPDPMGRDGQYTVRTLYFDGPELPCLRESREGVVPRSKYRLRLYNGDTGLIRAEIKRKTRSGSEKLSAVIGAETAEMLMSGRAVPGETENAVLREFALMLRTRALRPTVLCEYEREALVGEPGRVRVTFDSDLRATGDTGRFLCPDIGPAVPVFELGRGLMEVKYTSLLPVWILRGVVGPGQEKTAFSKYGMSSTAAHGLL